METKRDVTVTQQAPTSGAGAATETQKVPLGWPEPHVLHTMNVQRLFEFWHEANKNLINDTLVLQPGTVRAAPTGNRIPPAFRTEWNTLLCAWKEAEKIHGTIEADEVVNSATLQTWWHQKPRPTHLIVGLLQYETEDMDKPQWPRLIRGIVNDVFPKLESTPEIQREIINLLQKEPNFQKSLLTQWVQFDRLRKAADLPDVREEDRRTLLRLEDDKWDSEGEIKAVMPQALLHTDPTPPPTRLADPCAQILKQPRSVNPAEASMGDPDQPEAQRRKVGQPLSQAPGPMEAKFRDLCFLSGVEPDWSMLRCLREQDSTQATGIKPATPGIETTVVVTTPSEIQVDMSQVDNVPHEKDH